MIKVPIYSMLQYMKTAIKRTSNFLQDKSVDNSSIVYCQYIDEVLQNTTRFQANASNNVHDFHTIFEERGIFEKLTQ
ncbi:unnamed protein product [Acanthoscelides obtectus]|uniref:Uncharacterized protein n=1 Tax=Acanthoscelides obtectus TaxID=200917 RepID=A0A9P0Q944_ACAOB|nr:unnamed protein product [Acanthoscelides obtectus]CAK1677294.1 hypothetical protein AOBTE_LOCUS31230 [Acanthoscelides obtectus]